MKKIVTQKVHEEVLYYCDKHPDRECYSELRTMSWYGSQMDMLGIEIHLCDDCLMEVYDLLDKKFGVKPKDIEL